MSDLRLWFHEKVLARLDSPRERRIIAWLLAAIFLSALLGPPIRAQIANVLLPSVVIDAPTQGSVQSDPVQFTAHSVNGLLASLEFEVIDASGTSAFFKGVLNQNEPSQWTFSPFSGAASATYALKAHGLFGAATRIDSAPVSFSMKAAILQQPAPSIAPKITPTISLVATPISNATTTHLTASVSLYSFSAVRFTVFNKTAITSLPDIPGIQTSPTSWEADSPVLKPGTSYSFKAVGTELSGGELASIEQIIDVPASQSPPPPPQLTVTLSATLTSIVGNSVLMKALVAGGTAASVSFSVQSPNGFSKTVVASNTQAGAWDATTDLPVGVGYEIKAIATSLSGSQFPSNPETIVIPAPVVNPPLPMPIPVTNTTSTEAATTTAPTPPPIVEFLAPLEKAKLPSPVALLARVLNGHADKLAFKVTGSDGSEMFIVATADGEGGWKGTFEGKAGQYSAEARTILLSGAEIISPTKAFEIIAPVLPPEPRPPESATAPIQPVEEKHGAAERPAPPTEQPPLPTEEASTTPESSPTAASTETASQPPAAPPASKELEKECVEANISAGRCDAWLAVKYQNRDCFEAGLLTREACADHLSKKGRAAAEKDLIGLPTVAITETVREETAPLIGKPVAPNELPAAVKSAMSVEPPENAPVTFVRPAAPPTPEQEPSPAIVVIPESFAPYINPPSGAPAKPLPPVVKAFLSGAAFEEPRLRQDKKDPEMTVDSATTSPKPPEAATSTPIIRFTGRAAPGSIVSIYLYSFLPVVVTTTADANGNWKYDFHSKLADGRHEAYVAINDNTGKIVKTSSPFPFFVKEAKAASEADFLRPDVNVPQTPETDTRWFLYGGIFLVVLAGVLTVLIIRQVRRTPGA